MIKKMNKQKIHKYFFSLKGIDIEKIYKLYGITIISNINNIKENPKNTTKISELAFNKNTRDMISFLDESKQIHKCTVSFIDHKSGALHHGPGGPGQNTYTLPYNCFWDRNPIPKNIRGIGCPIKYIPNQAIKVYQSEITRSRYTIKENITNKQAKLKSKDSRLNITNRDSYITDGIYCSFNCVQAFIKANKHNSFYSNSETLLLKMYTDCTGNRVDTISSAHHWRKLKQYGGNLGIDQFRETLNRIEHKEYGIIKNIPIGWLFEERIKF